MSSKTKIVVLHLKELIYTGVFAALGILFIILLIIMLIPKKNTETESMQSASPTYVPGIYNTSLIVGGSSVDVEVTVDETSINDIRMINLNETVATMYPLLEPSLETIAAQILENQSLDSITYAEDNKYTSMVLLNAIKHSLEKASVKTPTA